MSGLGPGGGAAPAWYTPERLLGLFCCVTFLVFLDRGVIASNGVNGSPRTAASPGSGFQGEFGLTLFQDGILPAAFMVGLLVASVAFSELCKHFNAFRLIGAGLAVWLAASLGCGLSWGFWSFLACRVAMGAGEASIINLSTPFIDDVAPPASKSLWFGILQLFPTVGIAGGYIFGGVVGEAAGWRVPFLIQTAVAAPVVAFCLLAPPIALKTVHSAEEAEAGQADSEAAAAAADDCGGGGAGAAAAAAQPPLRSLWEDCKTLWRHPLYVYNLWAYVPVQAAFGAYAYWGPKAAKELFGLQGETVDLTFGGVTIITAVVAILLGAAALDWAGSSQVNAMALNAWSVLVGVVVLIFSFTVPRNFPFFMAAFAVGELAMFAGTAAASAVAVWSVPLRLRPLAAGMMTVMQHLFGDVPSPPLTGLLQDLIGNWRTTMLYLTLTMLIAIALYFVGQHVAKTAPDYRRPEDLVALGLPVPGDLLAKAGAVAAEALGAAPKHEAADQVPLLQAGRRDSSQSVNDAEAQLPRG